MAAKQPGGEVPRRITEGASFVSKPAVDCPANTIYMPDITKPLFGVSQIPIEIGAVGTFHQDGVFLFDLPDGWVSDEGQAVYWVPTDTVSGDFSTSGGVLIGHEVLDADNTWALAIAITPGAGMAANQADSTAVDVAGVVADLNTLLASLKAAGLMVDDAA